MFKCFRDCAYLDLMEDRAAAEKTANRSYSYPRHSMMGTGKSANRRQQGGEDEEEEKEDYYDGDSTYDEEYGDSEDDIYNTEDERVDERSSHTPGPDELTGEYRRDNAAHQMENTPGMSQGMNRHSVSFVPQSSRRPGRRKASPDSSNNAAVAASYGAPVSATAAATMGAPSVPNPEEEPEKREGRTILAKRTETDLAREATEKTTGASSGRRTVSTCVNHVRQSQDRTTLYVIKSKGAMAYKLAYDDIVEVDEISSEEKVVLIAKDVEVHIEFKGRAASLKKFCTTLRSTMSASSPLKGNTDSNGNPYTSSK